MMKMLVVLDEDKILTDGIYSLDKINDFISDAFKKRNMTRDAEGWYINGTFSSCGSLALILSQKEWFMSNVRQWLWYDEEDDSVEDLKVHYTKERGWA